VTHELKCWPQFFEPLFDGQKTFELRKDDRGFAVGDKLVIKEWSPVTKKYTAKWLTRVVIYKLDAKDLAFPKPALAQGYCLLGLAREDETALVAKALMSRLDALEGELETLRKPRAPSEGASS